MSAIAARAPLTAKSLAPQAERLPMSAIAARGPLTAKSLAPQADVTAAEPDQARSAHGSGTPPGHAVLGAVPLRAAPDADQAIIAMYTTEYRSLVRMSVVLVGDVGTAEEVVQESFVAMYGAWCRLRDIDRAVSYLRRSVVNRSRSVLRRRIVADRHAPKHEPDMPSAEQGAITQLERRAVIAALRSLPARQREAVMLRYYLDLSEEEVASAMKISRGAVKSHTARAKAALRSVLELER
jgi:RNA polymerase sigma-70 factor (sigma-E family)